MMGHVSWIEKFIVVEIVAVLVAIVVIGLPGCRDSSPTIRACRVISVVGGGTPGTLVAVQQSTYTLVEDDFGKRWMVSGIVGEVDDVFNMRPHSGQLCWEVGRP